MEFSTVWVVYSQNKEVDISEFHFFLLLLFFLIHATRAGQKVTLRTHRVQFNARGLSSIIASVHRRNRVLTFSSLCCIFSFSFWPLFFFLLLSFPQCFRSRTKPKNKNFEKSGKKTFWQRQSRFTWPTASVRTMKTCFARFCLFQTASL